MQTNNYEEARTFFINHSQHGWKHIESSILSERMVDILLEKVFLLLFSTDLYLPLFL